MVNIGLLKILRSDQSTVIHLSEPDRCHHHAFEKSVFIIYSAASFLRGALFTLGLSASTATEGFLEALRFKRALMVDRFRLFPNEPMVRLPFFDFLSPLPMNEYDNYGAIIERSFDFTKFRA
jgi:hypothetical protein